MIFSSYSFTKFRVGSYKNENGCVNGGVYVYESNASTNYDQDRIVFCGNLDKNLPEIKSKNNTMYVESLTDYDYSEGFFGEISFVYGEYSNILCVYIFFFFYFDYITLRDLLYLMIIGIRNLIINRRVSYNYIYVYY